MLNSKLLFILVINVAVLAVNIMLFADNKTELELKNQTLAIKENNSQSIAESPITDIQPQFTPVAPLPLVIEKKENLKEIKRLSQEKRKSRKKSASLQAQLSLLVKQNQKLSEQITRLENEAQTQHSYITLLEKNNSDQQEVEPQQPALIVSDIDLLKTNIQRQPDLIENKSSAASSIKQDALAEKIESAGEPDLLVTKDKEADNFSGSVEFGFSYEQDNKVTRAVNGRLVLDYEQADQYKFNSNLKFELEEEEREMTTEKYRWQLQADYYLDPRNLLFARSDIQRSQFASYDQEDVYTVGYGRIVFDQSKHKFNMEIGPGYRTAVPNNGENAVSVNEFIVRTRLNYERVVSESLQVIMNTVWEMGNENSIYSVNFKAQNKIYRELYLIFDFEYKYTQNVPVDTLNKEVTTGLNLMYAF